MSADAGLLGRRSAWHCRGSALRLAAMQKIGILGSGIVGETLANGFLKHGHAVMRGSREAEKLA